MLWFKIFQISFISIFLCFVFLVEPLLRGHPRGNGKWLLNKGWLLNRGWPLNKGSSGIGLKLT